MEIVILDGYTLNPGDLSWEKLETLGNLTVYDRTPKNLISERIGGAEVVFTNKTPLDRITIEQSPNLRFVGVLATGYNVVDCQAARQRNIPVCNIPTYGTRSVAQYVFALLLEICHHVGGHCKSVKNGKWQTCPDFCYWETPLIELANKTMGLIGYGRIGRQVGEIAAAFGMNVIACDRFPSESLGTARMCDFEEVLAESDVISLHCPLFAETQGIINSQSIAKMKDGVILINTSRGPLIVEEDLASALRSGKVYAAAVDVVSTEPIDSDNPLLQAPNCVITPHIAWAPKESRKRLLDIAVSNLESFLAENPQNVVN